MTRKDAQCAICTEVYHTSNAALATVKETPNAGGMARELAAQDSKSPTKQNG